VLFINFEIKVNNTSSNHPDKYSKSKIREEAAFFKNYLEPYPLLSNSALSAPSFYTPSRFNPMLIMKSSNHSSVNKMSK
jgi:hypothetical protein